MAGQKHEGLTTDDLLRLQEGPPLKKIRLSASTSVDSGYFIGLHDESGSGSSEYPGDDLTDQEEDPQDGDESFLGQADEDEEGSDHWELRGAIEDSGRLKLARASSLSTRTPRPAAETPKRSARSFNDIGISPALEAALHRMSIHTPTEVQAACIPPILAGVD